MKLMIDGYEVEIKAKSRWNKRSNKQDTMNLLNTICIWAGEAAEYNEMRFGKRERPGSDRRASDEIYKYLRENGAYDHLYENET